MKPSLIVSTSGTAHLASSLANLLSVPWVQINSDVFPNEELKVAISEAGETTLLLGSLSRPVNTRLVEYCLAADALKRMGCKDLVGVLTWYAYSKQDKVFLPGEPLSAQVVASMIQSAGVTSLVTLDLHSQAIRDFFSIPVSAISAVPLFTKHLLESDLADTVVVSPDKGSIKNATLFASVLNLPLVNATKSRSLESGEVTIHGLSEPVRSKNILIFDDMISTGSTLVKLSSYLHQEGASRVTVCCTHHLYLDGVQEQINASHIDSLIVSNSIEKPSTVESQKLSILDISPTLSEVLEPITKQ